MTRLRVVNLLKFVSIGAFDRSLVDGILQRRIRVSFGKIVIIIVKEIVSGIVWIIFSAKSSRC